MTSPTVVMRPRVVTRGSGGAVGLDPDGRAVPCRHRLRLTVATH